ncbi:endolysin [Gordonia phage OneUp]|uniref:Endolysin n=1 Tax=Gordonia phage OneUp TaxID=1838074 RepID=A0A160DET0_9CAUD|nr:endolysin [Gordonia phage OneUp]ANA86378.1 endolysin [Gordonia phage OneUp]
MSRVILPHTYHAQLKGYTCGPSAAKVVLSTYGISVTEAQMERECGTTVNGTDDVRQINNVLTKRTGRRYTANYMPADPPSRAQKDLFWECVLETIRDSRRGMPINIWAPANNHPPGYPNYMIMHYITGVGVDEDERLVYISDSGRFGGIEHYWIGADRLCTMITPKGYGTLAEPDKSGPFGSLSEAEKRALAANFAQLGPC